MALGFVSGIVLAPLVSVVATAAAYFGTSAVLMRLPANRKQARPEDGVKIYVQSNGVHVDLVLPVKTGAPHTEVDWSEKFPKAHFQDVGDEHDWIAIGWGDRGFYLDTPTWAELKPKTALKALFYLSSTVMHVKYFRQAELRESKLCRAVVLRDDEYQRVVQYILDSFVVQEREFDLIPGRGYAQNDNFYTAKGRYHMFKTCNVWANKGLKIAGVKTATWAPMQKAVLYHLPEALGGEPAAVAAVDDEARR